MSSGGADAAAGPSTPKAPDPFRWGWGSPHDAEVTRRIAWIETLGIQELRVEWRKVFRRLPAPGLTKWLLTRMLVHQTQIDVYGDLDPKTQAYIDRLVAKLASGTREGPLVKPLPTSGLHPGTTLIRDWKGREEHVMVLQDGYAWNGKTWKSLSEVARQITGTSWNGWTFFGLKGGRKSAGPIEAGRKRVGAGPDGKLPARAVDGVRKGRGAPSNLASLPPPQQVP